MSTINLTPQDKNALLTLARKSILFYLDNKKTPSIDELNIEISTELKSIAAGFVTLTKDKSLRGCIGEVIGTRELYQTVLERAISAAFQDPRFPKLEKSEFNEIEIEISVLTQPENIDNYQDIEIGKHGIILTKNGHSALFLPQVAVEQNWDLTTTLNHLAVKAGINSNDWSTDCQFQVFEAIIFKELDEY